MNGIKLQDEKGKEILPINELMHGYCSIDDCGAILSSFKGNEKVLSNDAMSFILIKEKEIKEYEEEVSIAENNLKAAKSKLYSSKHCLESFKKNLNL